MYWMDDELAAQTVEDRVAYIGKWAASAEQGGEGDPLSWYTDTADPIVVLEDTDGDGTWERARRTVAEYSDVARGCAAGIEVREGTSPLREHPRADRAARPGPQRRDRFAGGSCRAASA